MSLRSFKQYMAESKNEVYFTFGRMNPPTIGHERLLDKLKEYAGNTPYKIYLSKSHDTKKNPLLYEDKIRYSRKFFPRHARSIVEENTVKDILGAAVALYEDGYKSIVCVVGDDRVNEFRERLNLYNGKKGRHGLYVFESIKVKSAGLRDPENNNISGASASKLREAAHANNFVGFSQGLPKNITNAEAKKLYNEVRVGLGLNEERSFKNHIIMQPISETRERYVRGELFEEGESVVIKKTQEIATLKILGSNYVIIETANGQRFRKWLDDVEKVN